MIDISIDTKTLLAAVKASLPHLTMEVHLPAMSRLWLKAKDGKLTIFAWRGTSGRRQDIECDVRDEGEIVISGKSLSSVLSGLRGDTVRLSAEETTYWVTIQCGRSKIKQPAHPASDYPDVPELPGDVELHEVDAGALATALKRVLFSAKTDEAPVNLNAVHVAESKSGTEVVTTDGHRLTAFSMAKGAWPLPTKTLSLHGAHALLRESDGRNDVMVGVESSGRYIVARFADDTWTATRLVEQKFPPYVAVIPKGKKGTITVDRADLIGALRIVMPTAEVKTRCVALYIEESTLTVHADSDSGVASSEVDIESTGSNPKAIGVSAPYLIDALEHAEEDRVSIDFETELDAMVVREGPYCAVVMPARLSGKASRA